MARAFFHLNERARSMFLYRDFNQLILMRIFIDTAI